MPLVCLARKVLLGPVLGGDIRRLTLGRTGTFTSLLQTPVASSSHDCGNHVGRFCSTNIFGGLEFDVVAIRQNRYPPIARAQKTISSVQGKGVCGVSSRRGADS